MPPTTMLEQRSKRRIKTDKRDAEIIVRRAGKDEKFVTLDGQERTMDETFS